MRNPCGRGVWLFLGCLAFFVVGNGLASLFFAGNGLASRLMSGPMRNRVLVLTLYLACMGMIGGQAAVHSIGCVFASLHWAKRFLAGATSAIVLFGGLLVPPFLAGRIRHGYVADLAATLLCLPLFLLAAQTPLWIMRMWFRWRIVHRDDAESGHFEPLRIGGLLIAMTVIGIALTAVRASQSLTASSGNRSIAGLVVAALVVMVISAIIVLPAVLAGLYARRLPLALGLAFAADTAVVVGYVALVVAFGRAPGPLNWEVFVGVPAVAGGYFVALTVPMLIARRLGYRLLWGRGCPRPDCSATCERIDCQPQTDMP